MMHSFKFTIFHLTLNLGGKVKLRLGNLKSVVLNVMGGGKHPRKRTKLSGKKNKTDITSLCIRKTLRLYAIILITEILLSSK